MPEQSGEPFEKSCGICREVIKIVIARWNIAVMKIWFFRLFFLPTPLKTVDWRKKSARFIQFF